MATRILTRPTGSMSRRFGAHPDWCARGHYCGLGEHRAAPVALGIPGRAAVVLTRVQTAAGRQYVEITTNVALAPGDTEARVQLAHILTELNAHLRRLARPPG